MKENEESRIWTDGREPESANPVKVAIVEKVHRHPKKGTLITLT